MAKIIGIVSFMNAAGAQEALLRLARHMRARGHDMEVWFLYQEDDIHAGEPSIKILSPKAKLSPLDYGRVFLKLVAGLRRSRPDAVVGFLPLGNVFGMLAATIAGIRWRVASQRAPGSTFGAVMRRLDRLLGSTPVYRRIVCVSNAVAKSFDRYPQTYRSKLSVVHNGIEWKASDLGKAAARERLGLPLDSFLFTAIGRMKAQKNYGFMLRAFAGGPPAGLLVIAGDGLLRDGLEQQAKELGIAARVLFLGALDRDSIRHLLRATDVFVQTSLYEGQSNAVLEAMQEGLPLLLSDIPEQRETIVDERTGTAHGVLVKLDDLPAWQRGFVQLHDDEPLRLRLAAGARAFVNERFTLAAMIDGFERELVPHASRAAR